MLNFPTRAEPTIILLDNRLSFNKVDQQDTGGVRSLSIKYSIGEADHLQPIRI